MKTEAIHGVRVVRAAGRKDRHSKVCTARGTRDRRLRLSPKTAILFYDVQDRLGYDRPSKAIDWLMKEAKAAIDALDHPTPVAAAGSNMFKLEETNPQVSAGFGFFDEGAAPSSINRSDDCYREEFLPEPAPAPAPSPLELFDSSSEIVRLQRFFYAANAGGEEEEEDYSSVVSAAAPPSLHMFSEREPLQSSFQGFRFSDVELPDFQF